MNVILFNAKSSISGFLYTVHSCQKGSLTDQKLLFFQLFRHVRKLLKRASAFYHASNLLHDKKLKAELSKDPVLTMKLNL